MSSGMFTDQREGDAPDRAGSVIESWPNQEGGICGAMGQFGECFPGLAQGLRRAFVDRCRMGDHVGGDVHLLQLRVQTETLYANG